MLTQAEAQALMQVLSDHVNYDYVSPPLSEHLHAIRMRLREILRLWQRDEERSGGGE